MRNSLVSICVLIVAGCADAVHDPVHDNVHNGMHSAETSDSEGLRTSGGAASASLIGGTSTTLSGYGEGDFHIVGDVDADGYDDIVAVDAATGRLAVFAGAAGGPAGTPSTTLAGTVGRHAAVEGAGDVDGDGYDDVVVGDPTFRHGVGRVLLYLGSARGLPTAASQTIVGATSGDTVGSELARMGDVNDDGYDDFAVTRSAGREVGVYYGTPFGVATGSSTSIATDYHPVNITGYTANGVTGEGISGGDVNGDGFGDLVVGWVHQRVSRGGFYTYLGSASGMATTGAAFEYPYPTFYSTWCDGPPFMGWAVDAHADFDGDGYDDVAAAAPFDTCDGYVYVWYGGASGVGFARWSELYGYEVGVSHLGRSLATGDWNGDGVGDLGMGGTLASSAEGAFARSSRSVEQVEYVSPLAATASAVEARVQGAGDVNGDGLDDMLVSVSPGDGTYSLLVEYGGP